MKGAATLSLSLNALLAGFVAWLMFVGPSRQKGDSASRLLTNRVLRAKHQPVPPPAGAAAPVVMEVNEPFHWGQIESTDYRVYLANLRAMGCPEPTVRDIIVADVNELFHPRVKALVDEVSGQFWSLLSRKEDFEKMVDEKHDQLRELDHERDEILTALFGDRDPRREEHEQQTELEQRERWERLADFLPAEKRARFAAANAERERLWGEFLRTPELTDAQRQAKRKELNAAHEAALGEWLAPDELDELRLRQSGAANLRQRIVGVDLSAEEMRLAAKIQLAKDNPKAGKREPELQSPEAYFQELLGPERYAAFQRGADPGFAAFYRVTQRLELPDATAAEAFNIRQQAEAGVQRVRMNHALSVAERQAMLQAIGAETRQSLSAALGLKGFTAYERLDGGWMQQIAARPK